MRDSANYYWPTPKKSTKEMIKFTISGAISGIAFWTFSAPCDFVKIQIQTDNPVHPKYKGIIDCFAKSIKKGGIQIFFTGIPLVMLRGAIVSALLFIIYEESLLYLLDENEN